MTDQPSPNCAPRAFVSAPDPSRYFPASVIEEARLRVGRSIERGEGPALVIGAVGTGKTLLLEVLAEQFRGQRDIAPLAGAQLFSRRALLQMILFQLGLPFQDLDEGDLRVSLHAHLRPREGAVRPLLILVDEADSLPTRLLEELRMLTNLSEQGQVLVSVVLAGSANLEERFADPKMDVFSQRLSSRCYLAPLGREESFQYVRAQVAASGGNPDELFTSDGLEAIFAATDGVPRLVNQLGDQLLWMAHETGLVPLDGAIVQQAWSELQQLPAPWNSSSMESVESMDTVGEFGASAIGNEEFDDDLHASCDDEHPASIPISVSTEEAARSVDQPYGETFDATERVLAQLEQLEPLVNASASYEDSAVDASPNPFAEPFDSEEVVLDRYSEFERQLLAGAQRVVNQTDTGFANQLRAYQSADPREVSYEQAGTSDQDSSAGAEVHSAPSSATANVIMGDHGDVMEADSTPVHQEPGEILIVENDGQSEAKIVAGQQFRQLFSSLETGCEVSGNGLQ